MKEVHNFIYDDNIDHTKSTERLIQIGKLVSESKQIAFIGGEVYVPERTCRNITDSEGGFLCDVCTFGDFGGLRGTKVNYCPNCGAKVIN